MCLLVQEFHCKGHGLLGINADLSFSLNPLAHLVPIAQADGSSAALFLSLWGAGQSFTHLSVLMIV